MVSTLRRIDHLFCLYLEAGGQTPSVIVSSTPLVNDNGARLIKYSGMPVIVDPWSQYGALAIMPADKAAEIEAPDITVRRLRLTVETGTEKSVAIAHEASEQVDR